jgi:replication-associated recombination protein RarA
MRALEARLGRFLDDGVSRSCLMVGPPGTGKSMAIRWIARRLGVTSVRVDLSVLARFHGSYGEQQIVASLETVLKLLRPEALILDDLDRVEVGGPMLAFLELAARTCRFILASANCTEKMIGAALRPGRFDEIVRVERLDADVLRQLLGAADQDLFERLAPLPAAYVAEFLKRRKVLGRDVAVSELPDLEARRELVDAATDRGH